jgi:hypothetical protein
LAVFAAAYSAAKKTAKDNEVDSYPMTLRSEGKADAWTANISLPTRIKGGLMNGF